MCYSIYILYAIKYNNCKQLNLQLKAIWGLASHSGHTRAHNTWISQNLIYTPQLISTWLLINKAIIKLIVVRWRARRTLCLMWFSQLKLLFLRYKEKGSLSHISQLSCSCVVHTDFSQERHTCEIIYLHILFIDINI